MRGFRPRGPVYWVRIRTDAPALWVEGAFGAMDGVGCHVYVYNAY